MALLEFAGACPRSWPRRWRKVKTLHGLLPICAWCKKIRDDQGYWKQVEVYVQEHTGADFTHRYLPRLPGNAACESHPPIELCGRVLASRSSRSIARRASTDVSTAVTIANQAEVFHRRSFSRRQNGLAPRHFSKGSLADFFQATNRPLSLQISRACPGAKPSCFTQLGAGSGKNWPSSVNTAVMPAKYRHRRDWQVLSLSRLCVHPHSPPFLDKTFMDRRP